jgi:hypothetical protein
VHTITAAKGTEHLTLQCGSLGDIASVLFEIFKSKLSNWKCAAHRLGWLWEKKNRLEDSNISGAHTLPSN